MKEITLKEAYEILKDAEAVLVFKELIRCHSLKAIIEGASQEQNL